MKKVIKPIITLFAISLLIACHSDDDTVTVPAVTINIPNTIVKATLVNDATINTNGDTEIQESEAIAYSGEIIIAPNQGIDDLTGIEHFVNMTLLRCTNNSLTSLDVSANTALTELSCTNNALTSLDVSKNIVLKELYCGGNSISTINLSNNSALELLWCSSNSLTTLNLTANTALTQLICKDNDLTALDVSANSALTYLHCQNNNLSSLNTANGNNTNFTHFDAAYGNTNLLCIQIDSGFTPPKSWNENSNTNYSFNCL